MGFSLINIDMGDETVPKSIIAAHSFWSDIYTKSPFLGAMLVLSLPVIIIYLIYTWGSIRKSERLLDERVNDIRARQKKRKGGK
ncbi:hypothetical protein CRG95_05905 [Escherichia sp. E4208]|nr:hypothetical protein [Escherichia coli]EFN6813090.1 hypothetical protein [Escherichia coli O110]EWY54152.1 hypothetical protein K427_09555 [Escherichia coli MP1]TGB86521.1 hypothetical protein CRG95_05905 [Escherichia sp. E4208]EEW7219442.1 hypothetical protein [Escherichia coli]